VALPEYAIRSGYVPRIWALRRVGSLLADVKQGNPDPALVSEALSIAKRFGVATDFTHFVVDAQGNANMTYSPVPVADVGSLAVGYDEAQDRVVVEASELQEEAEEGDEETATEENVAQPAMARFRITRGQAAAFVERANELMKAGRPSCPLCSRPMDPEGHVCPRSNGHVQH